MNGLEFINTLDAGQFRATNALWNELRLNDPWSVGYVSSLIEAKLFLCKEDWEMYYYELGAERDLLLANMPAEQVKLLNDHTLKQSNPGQIDRLHYSLKNLNYRYGRTALQMEEKGQILFEHALAKGIRITAGACIESVRFRTICETWNGIIIREKNTVDTLRRHFPQVDFVKTTGESDHQYAVDYTLYLGNKLVCAIQVKPPSYLGKAPFIVKARNANQQKNKAYLQEFGKPVFDIIAQSNGRVMNQEILKIIEELCLRE